MKNLKQYYKELGKLVYALAMADGFIQVEERMKLNDFVLKEMASHESEHDVSGMNKAFYVDFEFENSVERKLDTNACILSYKKFVDANFETGDEALVKRAFTLLKEVNASYSKRKEATILDIVRTQIDKLTNSVAR